MTAAVVHNRLYDPWSSSVRHSSYDPKDVAPLLDLLAIDYLVDSYRGLKAEEILLNDLLATDLEFDRAVATAATTRTADVIPSLKSPARKTERDVFYDLLATDRAVDGKSKVKLTSLCDPYARKESTVSRPAGVYASKTTSSSSPGGGEELIGDNVIMMELLSMDDSVDGVKQSIASAKSDEHSVIFELHETDLEVGGAKKKALILDDFMDLLNVDRAIDQRETVNRTKVKSKRSIFSAKEKYNAKIKDNFSG